jgi:hypothetical protein
MDQLEMGRLLLFDEVINSFLILSGGVMILEVGCCVTIAEMMRWRLDDLLASGKPLKVDFFVPAKMYH